MRLSEIRRMESLLNVLCDYSFRSKIRLKVFPLMEQHKKKNNGERQTQATVEKYAKQGLKLWIWKIRLKWFGKEKFGRFQ